jgi:hypothetical protein
VEVFLGASWLHWGDAPPPPGRPPAAAPPPLPPPPPRPPPTAHHWRDALAEAAAGAALAGAGAGTGALGPAQRRGRAEARRAKRLRRGADESDEEWVPESVANAAAAAAAAAAATEIAGPAAAGPAAAAGGPAGAAVVPPGGAAAGAGAVSGQGGEEEGGGGGAAASSALRTMFTYMLVGAGETLDSDRACSHALPCRRTLPASPAEAALDLGPLCYQTCDTPLTYPPTHPPVPTCPSRLTTEGAAPH